MIKIFILPLICLSNLVANSQSYTSYFTGNSNDIITTPASGVCMMGGASEDDEAMKWFLQRANGGDVLVLRASGSDGYNGYFYTDLGIVVNSVETIVCNNAMVANETYIHDKISKAEAIWFAGGDQWDYISYWRGTKIDSLINDGIQNRNIVIGGTSAGMAILGKYYYSAENGTITSAEALSNPYHTNATIDSVTFLKNTYLTDVITDTHYDSPDRKGRQVTFLARILTDYQTIGKGIACDEYTAVCIDENGIASVYGDANYDDFAYFIQPNCELSDYTPENCTLNNELQWNRNGEALKVYKIGGNSTGSKTFDLNDWKTGVGGDWQHWSIDGAILNEVIGQEISCSIGISEDLSNSISVYPNPANGIIQITGVAINSTYRIYNIEGKVITTGSIPINNQIDLTNLKKGIYFLETSNNALNHRTKVMVD